MYFLAIVAALVAINALYYIRGISILKQIYRKESPSPKRPILLALLSTGTILALCATQGDVVQDAIYLQPVAQVMSETPNRSAELDFVELDELSSADYSEENFKEITRIQSKLKAMGQDATIVNVAAARKIIMSSQVSTEQGVKKSDPKKTRGIIAVIGKVIEK
ncbi:hypothetical protein JYT83_00405 [bacterium AH-315-F18]|nr:hypothetical protein [bacterium AH-315-F18]